jgi:hypothetical protein
VLVFVAISRRLGGFRYGLVEDWLADDVILARPIAEIEKPAALAAKWKIGAALGIGGLAADGAAPLHIMRIPRFQRELRIGK